MSEDGAPNAFDLRLTAQDIDNDPISWLIVDEPEHGSVQVTAAGVFSYVPAANFFGVDVFTTQVHDGTSNSDLAYITINVAAINDAPQVTTASLY